TLDLSSLNSGDGDGKPTVQTIIDEINNYFKAPSAKVELGNLNNIQLASDTNSLPSGNPSLFNFDFDLQNLSSTKSQFFVTGLQVLDDTGANITNVSQPPKTIALQPDVAYNTNLGSSLVTITTATAPQGINIGDEIYLSPPGTPTVNGIPAANLTGY